MTNIRSRLQSVLCLGFLISTFPTIGAEPTVFEATPQVIRSAIGVTRQGTKIECWLHRDDLDLNTKKTRILLIGGLTGEAASVQTVQDAMQWFYASPKAVPWRDEFVLSAVPLANPDGMARNAGPQNRSGGDPSKGYPLSKDSFYHTPTSPEAAYLWRWIGMHAPDFVVDVRATALNENDEFQPDHEQLQKLIKKLHSAPYRAARDELTVQLTRVAPSETGTIPALKVVAASGEFLPQLLTALNEIGLKGPSAARSELQRRLDRSPLQVAEQLRGYYGHALPEVAYIPAVALIGRLRYGELAKDDREKIDVERIVAPFFDGDKGAKITQGNIQSGHLIFCELADRSQGEKRSRYVELAKAAAALAFEEDGKPRESMPFHSEMSDALFMGGPILAHVGALTGEQRYFDACIRHLRFMRGLCLRSDGLYRHSPLDEAAWGRGNGFPALGIALCLSQFPSDQPGRAELMEWFDSHMKSLSAHQDPTGCWHQVIDHPESYRELTATCMIGFAMLRGVREGWIDAATYQPAIDRAWYAVKTRVASDGRLVDVCTGTGKQKSLRDYYDRPAILGLDDRGGAMALLFATEMAVAR